MKQKWKQLVGHLFWLTLNAWLTVQDIRDVLARHWGGSLAEVEKENRERSSE